MCNIIRIHFGTISYTIKRCQNYADEQVWLSLCCLPLQLIPKSDVLIIFFSTKAIMYIYFTRKAIGRIVLTSLFLALSSSVVYFTLASTFTFGAYLVQHNGLRFHLVFR